MTANNDAHVATLRALADDFVDSSAALFTAERQALDAAIRALSADRGEAVAWWNGQRPTNDGLCYPSISWEGEDTNHDIPLFSGVNPHNAATPPSPAESPAFSFDALVAHGRANGANIVNGMPWSFTYMGLPVSHENDNRYLVNMPDGSTLDVYRSAAPSGVSDAVTDILWRIDNEADQFIDEKGMIYLRYLRERIAALTAQPQPGRVEGMP